MITERDKLKRVFSYRSELEVNRTIMGNLKKLYFFILASNFFQNLMRNSPELNDLRLLDLHSSKKTPHNSPNLSDLRFLYLHSNKKKLT